MRRERTELADIGDRQPALCYSCCSSLCARTSHHLRLESCHSRGAIDVICLNRNRPSARSQRGGPPEHNRCHLSSCKWMTPHFVRGAYWEFCVFSTRRPWTRGGPPWREAHWARPFYQIGLFKKAELTGSTYTRCGVIRTVFTAEATWVRTSAPAFHVVTSQHWLCRRGRSQPGLLIVFLISPAFSPDRDLSDPAPGIAGPSTRGN